MTVNELIKTVGRPYHKYDEQGLAAGCMTPVYLLYPDLPRFQWPEDSKLGEFMTVMFHEHLQKVPASEIQVGDLILIELFQGLVHPAVFIGGDRIIHCLSATGIEIMRFSWVRERGCFRCRQAD